MKDTIGMMRTALRAAVLFAVSITFAATVDVTAPGEYASAGEATDFVVSGGIGGNVTILAADDGCRVTLSDTTLDGVLAIDGDAELLLAGANAITTTKKSAISCTGALSITGDGSLAATAAGAKKTGVIAAVDLTVAGGATTLTIANPTAKNACGVSLSGNYFQTDGALTIVGESANYKQNGVFLASKDTSATIAGGTLDVTLAGEKSVGLAMDKATASGTMTGGEMRFAMSGNGAKGVKGDGSFTMSGGTLEATLTGGIVEDYFEYEDGDGNTWNYYVALTSSTKTSGGTSEYSTTSLINAGNYPVMDVSKCYAVKVGTLSISGGTVSISATGTAGRGLGAEHHGVLLALLHAVVSLHAQGVALNVQGDKLAVASGHGALEEVCLADEVRHELVDRVVVDLLRRAHLGHHALGHDDDIVGQGHGLGLVMGDVDGGDADLLLDAADLGAHRDAKLRVEV